MRKILLALFGVLLATSAWATVNEWGGFGGACSASTSSQVGSGETICFDFTTALSGGDLTQYFTVRNDYALACLLPNGAAGTPTATVYKCPTASGDTSTLCSLEIAPPAGNPLDGTGGTAAVQQACVGIGKGRYRVVLTAPSSGTAVFTVGDEQ